MCVFCIVDRILRVEKGVEYYSCRWDHENLKEERSKGCLGRE